MASINYDKMKPIQTSYRGTLFRSRLEARWAAFFDLLEWRWIYEPDDLGQWAPDFALIGLTRPIYVEVKPISAPDEETIIKMLTSPGEHLLVGLGPLGEGCCCGGSQRIGWFVEHSFHATDDAALIRVNFPGLPNSWGLISDIMSYEDRITGLPKEGDSHMVQPRDGEIQRLWAEATNTVRREYRTE